MLLTACNKGHQLPSQWTVPGDNVGFRRRNRELWVSHDSACTPNARLQGQANEPRSDCQHEQRTNLQLSCPYASMHVMQMHGQYIGTTGYSSGSGSAYVSRLAAWGVLGLPQSHGQQAVSQNCEAWP